jgi:hypothetical protein
MSRCGGSCAGAMCERSRPAPGGHPAARRHSIQSRDGASRRLKALYDADELFEFQYGDGGTRFIERLAVAYRTANSPTTCSSSSTRSGRGRRMPPPERPQIPSALRVLSPEPVPSSTPLLRTEKAVRGDGLFKPFGTGPPSGSLRPSAAGRCSDEPANDRICRGFRKPLADSTRQPSLIKRDSVVIKIGRFAGI